MTTIPVAVRNKILKEVNHCVVVKGEDTERCLVDAARRNDLTREQAEEIPGLMDFEEKDNE